jgi:NAD(P)-dependent dehydrogenase (short-subunit alcohol dehydrogenase family)
VSARAATLSAASTTPGGTATFVKTDVTVESEVEAPIQSAIDAYGQVDLAFNNAGVGETSHDVTHTKSAEDYHRIMNTNVLGVFLSLKHELRTMIGSGFGAIVNNASVTGLVGFPVRRSMPPVSMRSSG